MADINCAHCNEPWDVFGLRHDSIGYFEPGDGENFATLESGEAITAYLDKTGGETDQQIRTLLDAVDDLPSGHRSTIPELFEFWWNNTDYEYDDPETKAAKRIVETAIYRGVLLGQGCPSGSCLFEHRERGAHRDEQERQIAFGGVTDEDPASYCDF